MMILEVKDLSVAYGEIEALRGVSLTIDEGAVVALLGSNGAGKSTTLRAISGLVAPRAGSILFDGESIAGLSPRAIVKLGIAHVPEGRRVFPGLTVRENIMLGASNGNASTAVIGREADAMFDLFPSIKPFANALGWTLSGGQQQMVAVARGLMAKPRLLLLDEPSLGLAPVVMQAVFHIITEIHKRGTTVLLVEQNAHMALKVANWGYVLETGRLALGGDSVTLSRPRLRSNAPDCMSEAPEAFDRADSQPGAPRTYASSPQAHPRIRRGSALSRNDRSWHNAAPSATQAGGAEDLVIFEMTSLTSACS